MIDIEKLKPQIVKALMPLEPEKIVLFGSYAYGVPNEDSDIDLYIVTKDNFIPQTWREKSDIHLKVSNYLEDICEKYPTDIITHTKLMYEKFADMDSMFSRKILKKGVVLL